MFSIPSILSMPRNLFFSANLVVTDDVENAKRQSKHKKCKVKFAESQSLLDDVSKIVSTVKIRIGARMLI